MRRLKVFFGIVLVITCTLPFSSASANTGSLAAGSAAAHVSAEVLQASTQTEPLGSADAQQSVYRLFNPSNNEHFYTSDYAQRCALPKQGWRYEGSAWLSLSRSNRPVYRLVNKKTGIHHYTASQSERKALQKTKQWFSEGVFCYGSPTSGKPVYRLLEPNNQTHLFTTDIMERNALRKSGWSYEGVAWRVEAQGSPSDWVGDLNAAKKTSQLITVEATGTRAVVSLHVRKGTSWQQKLSTTDGWVGTNGVGKAREGVRTTPTGVLKPDLAFGIKDDPGSKMGWIKVDETHYWCGDSYSPLYNMFVSTRDRSDFNTAPSEHIIDYGCVYDYCLNMGWNAKRKPFQGSAFFLHCSSGRPTAGCVAVPASTMKRILRTVKPGCLIVIGTPTGIMKY